MRRRRLGLAVLVLILILVGGYSGFWFIAAGRVESGLVDWAQLLREQNLDLSWSGVRVEGFPFAFHIRLVEARLRSAAGNPADLAIPELSATVRPWRLREWQLSAPKGFDGMAGPTTDPVVHLAAHSGTGAALVAGDGGPQVWLILTDVDAEFGPTVHAETAHLWLTLPPHPPQSHTEPAFGLAADLHGVEVPSPPAPFKNPVDDIAFGVTLMGAFSPDQPAAAAAAWRDAGGTLELDHFDLHWSSLAVAGSGTLALGPDLQPIGGFSGSVSGYDEALGALVAAGQMRASDARLARVALAMLAKTGPDGRPEIATSFTIQNGQMYLGPAKLGPAPRIVWR